MDSTKSPSGVTRKAFFERIMEGFMSVTPRRRRKEPRGQKRRKLQVRLQMNCQPIEPQGVALFCESTVIILDFPENVKIKNRQQKNKMQKEIVQFMIQEGA